MAVLTTLGAGVRPPCASDRYTMSDRGRIADFPPGLVGDGQKYSTRSHPSNLQHDLTHFAHQYYVENRKVVWVENERAQAGISRRAQ